jgi:hypothetical protein
VLEGKRLPELVLSQLRYLSEPRTWCRMAPFAEKDHVVVVARVWRSDKARLETALSSPAPSELEQEPVSEPAEPPRAAEQPRPAEPSRPEAWPQPSRPTSAAPDIESEPAEPVPAEHALAELVLSEPVLSERGQRISEAPIRAHDRERARARSRLTQPGREGPPPGSGTESRPPAVRVTPPESPPSSLNVVERALRTSPAEPGTGGWPQPVVVVPGGHRPGKPDPLQRDQARARLPLAGSGRIMVLGCAVGSGQTTTTLLTGQLLSVVRGEAVAVVDFSAGAGSLTDQARLIPLLLPRNRAGGPAAGHDPAAAGERGLHVVVRGDADAETLITSVVSRYPLTLADPDAASVPRALRVTDQLILVAPASPQAAPALAMTMEWLEANDYARLAASAVVVMNGVSDASRDHVDKAAAVVSGRCRAVVRVPWDDRLRTRSNEGISATTVRAYTALAGVVVAALADAASGSVAR